MFRTLLKNFNRFFRSKDNDVILGRWNKHNSDIYMKWANYDNCYQTMHQSDLN